MDCFRVSESPSVKDIPESPNSRRLSLRIKGLAPFSIKGSTKLQVYIESNPPGPSFANGEDKKGRPWKVVQIKHALAQNALLRRDKPLQAFSLPNSIGICASETPSTLSITRGDPSSQHADRLVQSPPFPIICASKSSSLVNSTQEPPNGCTTDLESGKINTEVLLNNNTENEELTQQSAPRHFNKSRSRFDNYHGNYITIPGVLPAAPSPKPTFRVGDLINAVDITRHDPLRSYLSSSTADIVATANGYIQTRRRYMIVLQVCCAFMVCATLTHHGTRGLKARDLEFRQEHLAISPLEGENLSGYSKVLRLEDENNNPLDQDSYVWFTRIATIWFSDPAISTIGHLTEDSIKELLYRYHCKFSPVNREDIRDVRSQKSAHHSFGTDWNWGGKSGADLLDRQWRRADGKH